MIYEKNNCGKYEPKKLHISNLCTQTMFIIAYLLVSTQLKLMAHLQMLYSEWLDQDV